MQTHQYKSLQLSDGQLLSYYAINENNAATPILLIHGLPDACDSWNAIAAILGHSRPVYAVDLAGYGYSERPETYDVSLLAQAKYLADFLDKLGLKRVVLVGHDIGGGIAQIIAARNPQRIDRLVLINSVIDDYWPVLETRLLCVPLLGLMSMTLMERLMWKYIITKGFFNRKMVTDALIHRYRHWYQGSLGRRRLIRNARALKSADLTLLSDSIRILPIQTLILWGREDRYLDAEPAKKLCREMTHCRFVYIDDAGHYLLDEQPQRIADGIEKFLKA